MANMIQFDGFDGNKRSGTHCLACEEMLMDAVDGTLNAPDQAWFDRHIASCVTCSEMYADAQRGAAWLEMLKSPRPEPSTDLISRILAQTSGSTVQVEAESLPEYSGDVWNTGATPFLVPTPIVLPVHTGNLLEFAPRAANKRSAFGRMLLEPRLAMTAAMAFFSIALTLNLMGVRLNEIHTADLKPANLKRSFYVTNAQAVRYFDSLRVVHVMESRVEDLRQQNVDRELMRRERPSAPETQPEEQKDQKKQEPAPGTSRREVPLSEKARYVMTNATVPSEKQRLGAFWTGVSASANDKNTDKRTGSWT